VLVDEECPDKSYVGETPPDPSGLRNFVGVSLDARALQLARNNAMKDAVWQYVTWTGVKVSIVNQYLEVTHGLASAGLDPTVDLIIKDERKREALVRGARAKKYCQRGYGREPGSRAELWNAYVLITVPEDAHKQWEADLRQECERRYAAAARLHKSAQLDLREGRVLPGLASIDSSARALARAEQILVPCQPQDAIGVQEVQALGQSVVSGMTLTTLRAVAEIEPGQVPPDFALKAEYRSNPNNSVPVSGLPILFSSEGTTLLNTNTGPDGVASLRMGVIAQPSEVRFRAGIDAQAMGDRLPESFARGFQSMHVGYIVRVRWAPPPAKAAELLAALAAKLERDSYTVVMGNFVLGDDVNSDAAGPFGQRFGDLVKTQLDAGGRLRRVERRSLRGQTGSVGGLPSNAQAALARAAHADSVLYGKYYQEGEFVVVQGQLDDLNARQIAAGQVKIHRTVIPAEWELEPPYYDRHKQDVSAIQPTNDFDLKLWIDKGNGAVYREGEKLYVNVRAEVDCYLKLIYLDAGGNSVVIFPNSFQRDTRIRGGRTYQIPDDHAAFDFQIQEPFGAETLVAFASTNPFPPDRGREVGNGMVLLSESIDVIARNARGASVVGREARRAEARVTLTTMERVGER
jgi:hypothetical protein